jgi:hypothetical protein
VNQHPFFLTLGAPDLDQLIHQSTALFRLWHDLLEFLVEHFIPAAPVNFGKGDWKKESHEGFKVPVQGFLPGAVESLIDSSFPLENESLIVTGQDAARRRLL